MNHSTRPEADPSHRQLAEEAATAGRLVQYPQSAEQSLNDFHRRHRAQSLPAHTLAGLGGRLLTDQDLLHSILQHQQLVQSLGLPETIAGECLQTTNRIVASSAPNANSQLPFSFESQQQAAPQSSAYLPRPSNLDLLHCLLDSVHQQRSDLLASIPELQEQKHYLPVDGSHFLSSVSLLHSQSHQSGPVHRSLTQFPLANSVNPLFIQQHEPHSQRQGNATDHPLHSLEWLLARRHQLPPSFLRSVISAFLSSSSFLSDATLPLTNATTAPSSDFNEHLVLSQLRSQLNNEATPAAHAASSSLAGRRSDYDTLRCLLREAVDSSTPQINNLHAFATGRTGDTTEPYVLPLSSADQNQLRVPAHTPCSLTNWMGSSRTSLARGGGESSLAPDPFDRSMRGGEHQDGANDDSSPDFRSSKAQRRTGSGRVSFPIKLYDLIMAAEQTGKSDIVSFTESGRAFRVHDSAAFLQELVPNYFGHTRLASFKRQLGIYGFDRIPRGPHEGGYTHQYFRRGCPELLKMIRRAKRGESTARTETWQPDFSLL